MLSEQYKTALTGEFQTYLTAGAALTCITEVLVNQSDYDRPEGLPGVYAEILGVQIRLEQGHIVLPVSKSRRFNYRSMVAESLWNLNPTKDINFLLNYISNMRDFCEGTTTAQWAYGPYINRQIPKVVEDLRNYPDSRQAVIYTGIPDECTKKNSPPCLSTVQWFIRDGKLVQIVNMRSNDVYRGLPLDLVQFSLWQTLVGAALEIEVGEYIHNSGSMHLYERDLEDAKKFLETPCYAEALPRAGKHALEQALRRYPTDWVDGYLRTEDDGAKHLAASALQQQCPDLAPYLHLLLGHYANWPWSTLKEGGYGRGW